MMRSNLVSILLVLFVFCLALVASLQQNGYKPVVMFHGLGDTVSLNL